MSNILESLKNVSRGPTIDSFLMYDASTGQIEWRRWTKSLFFPFIRGGGAEIEAGAHSGWEIDANGEDAWCRIDIPDDFGALITAEVVWVALANTANMRFDTLMDGGAEGEALNTEGGTEQVVIDTPVVDQIYRSDITTTLADLEAGDYAGLYVIRPGAGNTDGVFYGVAIVYEVSLE